jgi:hypothetical protein
VLIYEVVEQTSPVVVVLLLEVLDELVEDGVVLDAAVVVALVVVLLESDVVLLEVVELAVVELSVDDAVVASVVASVLSSVVVCAVWEVVPSARRTRGSSLASAWVLLGLIPKSPSNARGVLTSVLTDLLPDQACSQIRNRLVVHHPQRPVRLYNRLFRLTSCIDKTCPQILAVHLLWRSPKTPIERPSVSTCRGEGQILAAGSDPLRLAQFQS